MYVVLAAEIYKVTDAYFEIYHEGEPEADWNLRVKLNGTVPQFLLSGIVDSPMLPGPSRLLPEIVDEPQYVLLDGRRGSLAVDLESDALTVTSDGDAARIAGSIQLGWCDLDPDSETPEQLYEVELDIRVPVISRRS
jgi:hypothetical protein